MIHRIRKLACLIIMITAGCVSPDIYQEQSQVIAFENINLIPMTENTVIAEQIVLVEGDRIIDIGDQNEINIPKGATVIDGHGAYLMPGLADMHVHIYQESRDEYPASPLNLYVAKGVTTIRDCGTAPVQPKDTFVLEWRDEILNKEIIGPMIYSSGRTIHGPVSNPGKVVEQRYNDGFDFVKLYFELSPDEYAEAQQVAEDLGMYSVGHIPYQVGFNQTISQGLDEIAHIEELTFSVLFENQRPTRVLSMNDWLSYLIEGSLANVEKITGFKAEDLTSTQRELIQKIVQDLINYDVPVGTTMVVNEVVNQKLSDPNSFINREESVYLPSSLIEEIQAGQNKHQLLAEAIQEYGDYDEIMQWKYGLDVYLLQQLHEAGVRIVSGTDSGSSSIGVVEGYSTHDDLRILTELGFTPYETLQTATVNAAYVVEKMTGSNEFGTIEIGKRADLVLVEGNPLVDITNTENILGVMLRGEWLTRPQLEDFIQVIE